VRLVALALSVFVSTASAEQTDWRTSWDGTLYGYAGNTNLRGDSVLNPGNQVARLTLNSDSAEGRFNLKAENDVFRITARPTARLTTNPARAGSCDPGRISRCPVSRGRPVRLPPRTAA